MRRNDPLRRMLQRMEDALNTVDDTAFAVDIGHGRVPVDVREDADSITVVADLPGFEQDQIDLQATADELQLRAVDDREVQHEAEQFYRHERTQRQVQRTVQLPGTVDPETAEATYENGVLTVTLDRTDRDSGHRINIS